jgi:hypothetical protein
VARPFLLGPGGCGSVALPDGTTAKMHFHRIGGEFRLEYLKSENAVLENGR